MAKLLPSDTALFRPTINPHTEMALQWIEEQYIYKQEGDTALLKLFCF
jgi:hypothetical protein